MSLFALFCAMLIARIGFKIESDRFYAYFHLLGGGLVGLFVYGFFESSTVSVLGTLLVGIGWELAEWLLWKFILKKMAYKPKPADTKNDIILDVVGSSVAVSILITISS